ncbi:MAG TPA: 50S ribosomal protein L25/general stress protein Ctc [Candidatus Anoxymicrobiaceae bacterium]
MELKLKARQRSETGKGAARQIRNEGEVPAVMYGHGIDPRSLAVKKEELGEVIHGRAGTNVLIDLQVVDGKDKTDHLVMIKELQRHPFKEKVLHVDFLKVARDEKVTMRVPISINGEEDSVGLRAGGTLQHNLWEVELECLPTEVPDHLFADISQVKVGDHLVIGDLELPASVHILADPDDVILTILAPRLAVEGEPTEEEAAQAKEEAAAAEAAAAAESGEEE